MSVKVGLEPVIHETARVTNSAIGRYTEISERCRIEEVEMGDYSYVMQDGAIWCATIGKFVNIAASVRINATNHPMQRATLHHFTYRARNYWDDAEDETDFCRSPRQTRCDRSRCLDRPRRHHPAWGRRWKRRGDRSRCCRLEGRSALHHRGRCTRKTDPGAFPRRTGPADG